VLNVVSDHGGAGRRIAEYANEHHAAMIVIGSPVDGEIAGLFDDTWSPDMIDSPATGSTWR
jgi:MFS transporter, ACDE family, multidrug resistance protein